jgi:hypothetical protein
MKETDLSQPITAYLQKQGYQVNGEVKNCDITAKKEDELIIVELKTRFSLALVYQVLDRKKITPAVYAAIPVSGSKKFPPNYGNIKNLLKHLEIGLILVRFLKTKTRVEVMLHPQPYELRKRKKKRLNIIREIEGRYGEFNKGGSRVTDQRISTYKQEAIRIAWLLSLKGDMSPKELKSLGCGNKTQQILSSNFYGWFNRVRRGVYSLEKEGLMALEGFKDVTDVLKAQNLGNKY